MPPFGLDRQYADAFNQPLSLDTSSVITMSSMFSVRFRLRRLPPRPSWATQAHAACAADLPFPLCHTSVPHTRRPSVGCPLLDSIGSMRMLSTSR